MTTKIRRYRPDDRKAVLAAFRSNVPEHFPASEEAWLRSALDEPDGPFFVVVEAGEVVAFGGYELSDFYDLGTLVFGLHAVNALAIMAVSGNVARRARTLVRPPAGSPASRARPSPPRS